MRSAIVSAAALGVPPNNGNTQPLHLPRQVGLDVKRLAPDHHNVGLIGYPTGRADDVFKFVPFHIHGKLPIAPLH
jgi:hypothetical protein